MLDNKVGKGNYLLFLTADHAVAEIPEMVNTKVKQRFSANEFKNSIKEYLSSIYGTDKIFADFSNKQIFLNYTIINEKKLNVEEIRKKLALYLRQKFNTVLLISTRDDMDGKIAGRDEKNFILNGFNPIRSGDIFIELNSLTYLELGGIDRTTHGTGYSYDTHVPLLFFGWHVPMEEINEPVYTVDIAPTIANMLKITEPSGCIGKPIIK
jgi:arylsulfatase A-like enzyme